MANIDPRGGSQPAHSLGELAGGLAGDVQDLVRGELALARAEFDHKLHGLIAGAISLIGGALVAFAGLVVVLEGGAAVVARWLPAWAALLIVGLLIVVVGGLIARAGLAQLSLKNLTPDRTAANLQKDGRILKEHL
ncbi:MAG: phage holin family protein [Hyphomicrobiales bacterium]|nr:MAG: phage holin family protein [Hyphomicrobiales bacterium]